jgi:hypothetical protein
LIESHWTGDLDVTEKLENKPAFGFRIFLYIRQSAAMENSEHPFEQFRSGSQVFVR